MSPLTTIRTAAASSLLTAALAGTSLAAGPWLFYFEKQGGGCAWNVLDAASKASRVAHETAECPRELVFDEQGGRSIYRLGPDIFSVAWKSEAEPVRLGRAAGDMRLWVSETGRLRSARLVPVEGKDVVRAGGKTSFRFEGALHDASGLVDWGTP